jgi:hypothetical protein
MLLISCFTHVLASVVTLKTVQKLLTCGLLTVYTSANRYPRGSPRCVLYCEAFSRGFAAVYTYSMMGLIWTMWLIIVHEHAYTAATYYKQLVTSFNLALGYGKQYH